MTSEDIYNSEEYKKLKKKLEDCEREKELFRSSLKSYKDGEREAINYANSVKLEREEVLGVIIKIVNKFS